jgi:hypothetical protein
MDISSTANVVDLQKQGIPPEQAADLRRRLKTFAEDWQRPEMDAYDGTIGPGTSGNKSLVLSRREKEP